MKVSPEVSKFRVKKLRVKYIFRVKKVRQLLKFLNSCTSGRGTRVAKTNNGLLTLCVLMLLLPNVGYHKQQLPTTDR